MARPAIVFIGFMGAGKSTALAAARKAGLETVEIDELMEREFGKPIRQAFEEDGEEAFRAREAEVVGTLLGKADGNAIALGGGSVLSERVREALDRHIVVLLEIDAAEAWKRIEGTDRPLATSEADVERLLAERLPLYEELADAVVPMADKGVVERALPAIQALAEMPEGTRLLWASSISGDYPVFVGAGTLETEWWPLQGRVFCVTDRNVAKYASRLRLRDKVLEIEPGERSKTLKQAEEVILEMAALGMTREDHVVAVGGGVVGDLAGFCAHVYQRGVPVVQVPTTVVAQVDSAYGGKTGVDVDELKNYAGAYHLPAAVLTDISTLESLPPRELAAGFVEVIKTGLLAGGSLWDQVRAMEAIDSSGLEEIVFACARYKCAVVASDERDAGLRHVLNLGHTVGHAIEGTSAFSYLHGEAIGLGLLAALRLSDAPELREEVRQILVRHNLPTKLDPAIEVDEVVAVLERDKKRTAAGVGFVLLSEPGKPRTGQLVDPAKVRAAVEELY
ncbi:MAG: shikimate kinase / 3-dehydroquinate synthase [Solirubrobacterales bacterium]|jgi:shikimate kinase/3-dehydroquinate synthase|nr:shikimate kinase / 3-dehydroquinate synthase [Solirubrobacterales bacterium]